MCLKFSIYVTLLIVSLVVTNGPQHVDASLWDSLPVISQMKSLVQVIGGDEKGAEQTQLNFINQAPVVSQVKSMAEAISGDEKAAQRTQEKFVNGFVEPLGDNMPVVGHIKGKKYERIGI